MTFKNTKIREFKKSQERKYMKKIKIIALIILFATFATSYAYAASQYVNGHFKKNGTYVQGYHRTTADKNRYNNYSTKGNINPYTGKKGTVNPYKTSKNKYNSYYKR